MFRFASIAPAALLATAAIAAPTSALAADTTPPSLSVAVGSGFLGVATIFNSGSSTSFGGHNSSVWSISGPNIAARSNEAGSIVFSWRDGVSGALKGRVTVPTGAGDRVGLPIGGQNSLIPVTNYGTGNAVSGIRHRLPAFSLQRFDAQAVDADGNKSAVRSVTTVVGPDINVPVAY